METMKLTENKKSSKGVIIGLLLFFIISGTILFFAIRAEEEPTVVGTNSNDVQTQNLVDIESVDKEALLEKN